MGLYMFNLPVSFLGDWKEMSIAHVIIIIKSKVSTFPIVIFFRGCVPEMFVTSYSVTCCLYVPGKPGICFHHYCAVYDECKYSDTFWLADRTRLFVQYIISLSSLCKLIWRHWTYKMLVRYILSSVWVRLNIFSPLSITQYVGLYVFSLSISVVMIERIYTLSYFHHQIGSMNYYPLSRVRPWNNGVRCMSSYILMTSSNRNIFRVTGPFCGEFTGEFPSQRSLTRGLHVSLIRAWTNSWINNRDAGDLRRHRAHYDVTVMINHPGPYISKSRDNVSLKCHLNTASLERLMRYCLSTHIIQ